MSYWRTEYDDGWWTFYKDGIDIKFDNPNFGDLIVDEINNANQRIAELESQQRWIKKSNQSLEVGKYLGWNIEHKLIFMFIVFDDESYVGKEFADYYMPLPQPPEVNNE